MKADDQFLQALHDGDRETSRLALNRLEQEVVEAIQTTDGERLEYAEVELAAVMRMLRREAAEESAQPYLNIGVVSGFHRILRALREDRPSHADLKFARAKNRMEFLKALRNGVALRAQDILERTSIGHLSTVSEVGKELEYAGLVRRDRTGKGAPYLLTLRGNLVAKHFADEDRDSQRGGGNTEAYPGGRPYGELRFHIDPALVERVLSATTFEALRRMWSRQSRAPCVLLAGALVSASQDAEAPAQDRRKNWEHIEPIRTPEDVRTNLTEDRTKWPAMLSK